MIALTAYGHRGSRSQDVYVQTAKKRPSDPARPGLDRGEPIFSNRSRGVHGRCGDRAYLPRMTIQAPAPATFSLPAVLRCANLEIRPSGYQALTAGRPIDLTAREFQLLLALAQRRN